MKICFSQQLKLFINKRVVESSPVFKLARLRSREIQMRLDAITVLASTNCAFIGLFIPVSCTLNPKHINYRSLSVCGTRMNTE